jgi:hypothetical protein
VHIEFSNRLVIVAITARSIGRTIARECGTEVLACDLLGAQAGSTPPRST